MSSEVWVDRIEREVVLQAPIERVWAALTTPEALRAWFGGVEAEIELRAGGAITFRWAEHGTFLARVLEVAPPERFSYRWALVADEAPRDGNSTTVVFTLVPEGAATRVRVVESGFEGLDGTDAARAAHLAANRQGWSGGLEALQAHLR